MPTPSTHMGLNVFSTADTFNTSQYDANWNLLDEYPGIFICTSTTRPGMAGGPTAWGANQTGMRIVETDTGLVWQWTGSAFARASGTGLLGRITRTSNIGTTTTWVPPGTGTLTTALTQTVQVPSGGRQLMIHAEVPEVQNPNGYSYLVLQRDSVILNSWPVITSQETGSGNASNPGTPGGFTTWDVPNETSAVYTLAFAANTATGGTTTLVGDATRPLGLTVVEF